MLDVTRLRVLAAVARTGSVTAAAQALHYAQPSVSHHLARLEAETGTRLVQRVGRGVRLTPAGRLLAERAEEILGRLASAATELAAHTGLEAGRVRLAAFPSALATVVPEAARRLLAVHPRVEVGFTEAEPPEAYEQLRAGEVDVALVFRHDQGTGQDPGAPDAPGAPDDRDVRTVPLFDEPRYLVAPADRTASELAGYAGERWIAGCERCARQQLEECRRAGFEPTVAFTTDDYVAVQALVAAGLGVTTLPGLALRASRHRDVRVLRLPGSTRRVLAASYGAAPDPPHTRALLDALLATAAAPPEPWPS